jgi:hypothetical protein
MTTDLPPHTRWLATFEDRCARGFHLTAQHPALCDCQDGDEWAVFTAALFAAARDGRVHQRVVRPHIRGRIEPNHVGILYRRALSEGLLREVDHERSDDVDGKNAGRLEPVYALRGAA